MPQPPPRIQVLLEGPVLPTLLRLSLPNCLNLFSIAALITFDGVLLGRLGIDALAGVSLVFPFVIAVQHLAASGMGGAVSAAVARALGAGDSARAEALAAHAFMLAIGLGAVATMIMLAMGPAIFRWMGGQGAVLAEAVEYSRFAFGGAVSICMLNILASVVRGTGNMAFAAAALVGAVAGHMALSPLLVFGFGPLRGLGAGGAGLSLVVAFGVAAAVLGLHLHGAASPVRLAPGRARYRWMLLRELFAVGIPGMINVAITSVTVIVMTAVAGRLGTATQTGYALGARLEYIVIPLAFVVGTALVAMVGANWGARRFRRARHIAWSGAAVAATACGCVGVFFAFFPALWMRLFTEDAEVLDAGSAYLRIAAPAYAAYGFGQALYFSAQGLGHPLPAVLANGARLAVTAGGGLLAICCFGAGARGAFAAIAAGFALYAALNAWILWRVRDPAPAAAPARG